jgi:uncharacterized protein YycO
MNPQPADLMFTFHPGGILSEAIARVTHAKISHVQMVMDVGASGTIRVVSAEAQGLIQKWVIPPTVPWYCLLTCEGLNLEKREEITEWMLNMLGVPYDVWGLVSFLVNVDMNNERKSFCSEVNFQAYEAKGIFLLDGVDHCFVSPRDLYMSPLLKTLDGSRKEVR